MMTQKINGRVLTACSLILFWSFISVTSAMADRNDYKHKSHHNDDTNTEEETVLDEKAGLTWQKEGNNGPFTWHEALEYVDTLNNDADGDGWAGCKSWYLPTAKELARVVDHFEHTGPRINTSYFTNTQEGWYWSSSSAKHDLKYAVSFEDGKQKKKSANNEYWVRAVHGQCDSEDKDGDGYSPSDAVPDCNDYDANINPGAAEVCDGRDNNCDGYSDTTCWDEDNDGDGQTENQGDCDDHDRFNFSGNSEVCDGRDNDCVGGVDNGLTFDADGDGHTSIGSCAGSADDCNDDDADIHPGADEICGDGINQDCVGGDLSCLDVDNDGDGYTENQNDCDDTDPLISPDADEICDGQDNDCDGGVDVGLPFTNYFLDNDGDNYGKGGRVSTCDGPPTGYVLDNTDCDDTASSVNPGVAEVTCDGINNDCNAATPDAPDGDGDGFSVCADCNDTNADIFPGNSESCDGLDNDCDGTADNGIADIVTGTDVGECQVGIQSCINGAFAVTQTQINAAAETCDGLDNDCDSVVDNGLADIVTGTDVGECQVGIQSCVNGAIAVTQTQINPSTEICDGLDNDCNSVVDNGIADIVTGTNVGECQVGIQSCVNGAFAVTQAQIDVSAEICDGLDNDCNSVVDNGLALTTYYQDSDSDTYGNAAVSQETCSGAPSGYVEDNTDCNDAASAVNPGVAEVTCDGVNNDCNVATLDGPDGDGDGVSVCTDCDDADANNFPGNLEVCDEADNNCDGIVDNGITFDLDADGYTSIDSCEGSRNDCDDGDDSVNPGAIEVCDDNIDNNCVNGVDEGCALPMVHLVEGDGYYDLIQYAYDTIPIATSGTVNLQAVTLNEGLILDRDVIVILKGGFNDTFSSVTGWTTISSTPGTPAMTINLGTAIVDRVGLR
jgi:hypothetical protein